MEPYKRSMYSCGKKNVFVTVGTTKFDELIKAVSSEVVQRLLSSLGFDSLTLQIGNGEYFPTCSYPNNFTCNWYRFKEDLTSDMKSASFIISHAGAGSIMESLEVNKALLVVVNETLMENHQLELAYQLHKEKYLSFCTCESLHSEIVNVCNQSRERKKYEPGNPVLFGQYLNNFLEIT